MYRVAGDDSAVHLAHQNRTIAIASDFRIDGAKSPEIPQKEGVLGSAILGVSNWQVFLVT